MNQGRYQYENCFELVLAVDIIFIYQFLGKISLELQSLEPKSTNEVFGSWELWTSIPSKFSGLPTLSTT